MQNKARPRKRSAIQNRQPADVAQSQTTEPDIVDAEPELSIDGGGRDPEILRAQHDNPRLAAAAARLDQSSNRRFLRDSRRGTDAGAYKLT